MIYARSRISRCLLKKISASSIVFQIWHILDLSCRYRKFGVLSCPTRKGRDLLFMELLDSDKKKAKRYLAMHYNSFLEY